MRGNLCLIITLLCVPVEMGMVGSDCDCDCQQLRIENSLMKHFLIPTQAPDSPDTELRASFDEVNTDSPTAAPSLWTESLIISTYKTFVTSLALTEIPIWWRNRQDKSTLTSNL